MVDLFWRHIALWKGRRKASHSSWGPQSTLFTSLERANTFLLLAPLFFYWRFSTVSSFVLSWQVGLFSKAVPPRIHTAFSSLSPARLPATANSFRSVKPRQLTTLATRVGMCHTAKQTAVGSSHLRVIAEVKWWSSKQTERGIPWMASLLCSNIRSECWRRDATW